MTQSLPKRPSPLVYDEKGSTVVNEQIMNSYNSGSINKKGLLEDTYSYKEREEEGTTFANQQIMNSYSSGSINKLGLHGDLFGPRGTEKQK